MLYRAARAVTRFILSQFYRRRLVLGKKFERDAPLIVLANHFNGGLDPILLAATLDRRCHFIARSEVPMFKRWFLRPLARMIGMIPVYRADDGHDTSKNTEMFSKVIEVLDNNGCIVIFPTKKNEDVRWLYQFATGFARMAFETEAQHDFKRGVMVQPVGINYNDIWSFGSTVTVKVGKPERIATGHWKSRYEEDPFSAARELADLMKQRVGQLVVEVGQAEQRELVDKIAKVFEGSDRDDFSRLALIADKVAEIAPTDPALAGRAEAQIEEYLREVNSLSIVAGSEEAPGRGWFFSLLLAPFVLLGAFLHYLPYRLSGALTSALVLKSYHWATRKLFFGVALTALWYVVIGTALWLFGVNSWLLAGVLLGMMILGALANALRSRINVFVTAYFTFFRRRRLNRARKMGTELRSELLELAGEN